MDQGLVIVPAGAGAGKTHRIKTQLSDWVKRGVVRPERILAVTFTEAAAGELRERIRAGLLADGLVSEAMAIERAYVSTIHGLGLRLLTEHALAAGASPQPRHLGDAERDLLIRQALAHAKSLDPIKAEPERFGYEPNGQKGATVEDNLRMGTATCPPGTPIPEELFELFPVLRQMLHRRGGDLSGGQQQQLAIARALAFKPQLLVLDEPTEGIQPSVIKDIGRVIRRLADEGLQGQRMAIVLCEQYYDFAQELADQYLVMERGEVIAQGPGSEMAEKNVRQLVAI